MKGIDLHARVKISGLGWKKVSDTLGLSKQGLYDLYKKDDIGEKYFRKAKELGLTEIELGQVGKVGEVLTAREALEIAERMSNQIRADYIDRIEELNRHIELLTSLVREKKKVA